MIRAHVHLRPGDHGYAVRVGDLRELRRSCAGLPMATGELTAEVGNADARAILKANAMIEVGGHAPSVRSGQRDEALRSAADRRIVRWLFSILGADVERFARERDALAALTHPHIACLYGAGRLYRRRRGLSQGARLRQ